MAAMAAKRDEAQAQLTQWQAKADDALSRMDDAKGQADRTAQQVTQARTQQQQTMQKFIAASTRMSTLAREWDNKYHALPQTATLTAARDTAQGQLQQARAASLSPLKTDPQYAKLIRQRNEIESRRMHR